MDNLKDYFDSLFTYDSETGFLYWKYRQQSSRANNIFNALYAGKVVGSEKVGVNSKTPYLSTRIKGKHYFVHRIIFCMLHGYMPEQVDHIDHNGLNNKPENLRASNDKDNSRNLPMQKSNKSGHIGVNWHKPAKKWQARAVNENGKRIDLGRFDDIEDAISARKEHEIKFGYYEFRSDV